MKVEVKEKGNKIEIKYPCLMKSSNYGVIVLFISQKCGTCLDVGHSNNELGEYSDYWDMDCFSPFDGEITLKND